MTSSVKIAGCGLCKRSFKSHPWGFDAVCCQVCITDHIINEANPDKAIDALASLYGVDGLWALGILVEVNSEELAVTYPLRIAEDPECGYGRPIGFVS